MDSIWCYLRSHQVPVWCWFPVQKRSTRKPVNTESLHAEMSATLPAVGYPSVHCGLTASRVRSRAHLLKSGGKMTGLNVSE